MVSYIDIRNGYLGNNKLKRPGVKIEWTKELVDEYMKCSQDPIYFIETYMKIINMDEGLVSFKLRDYQKDIINSIHNNRNTIICTARQAGKSVTMIGYILWFVLFNQTVTVALLANKGETAREILSKFHLGYESLPKWLQSGVIEWNKGSVELENGSRVFADSTSASSVRGYTINLLVLDEAAHIENWEEFSISVMPTISSGTTSKVVQISTPNGLNHFYKTWILATSKRSKYHPIMVPWSRVPGRDEEWRQNTLAEMNFDSDKFAQEFGCEFQGSSGTLIAGWKLKELVPEIPLFEKDHLFKYADPVKNHNYVITVDVSEGKMLDYSAFQVIDITEMPYRQVACFYSNITPPSELAQTIRNMGKYYNGAFVLIEFENLGPQVAESLFSDLEYDNLLYTESAGSIGKRITFNAGKGVDKGVKMTITVKRTGCSILKLLVEQNQLILNDYNTIHELSRFSKKGNTYQAEPGEHDDLSMCLIIFAWLSDQKVFRELTDINTIEKLRDRTALQIEEEMMPIGYNNTETHLTVEEHYEANWLWKESDEKLHNF